MPRGRRSSQEALQEVAQHAKILEGKIGRYRFRANAKESFLFTTPNFEQMGLNLNADAVSRNDFVMLKKRSTLSGR